MRLRTGFFFEFSDIFLIRQKKMCGSAFPSQINRSASNTAHTLQHLLSVRSIQNFYYTATEQVTQCERQIDILFILRD